MTETSDRQPINVNSTAEEKIAYMRDLLEALHAIDGNHDGKITTAELANDDVKKYLEYRNRIDRPGANKDPLGELREDLQGALKGDAVARDNVITTLQSINAADPQGLRTGLETAVKLTGKPRDVAAEQRQADHDQMVSNVAGAERDVAGQAPAGLQKELHEAFAKAVPQAEAARASLNQQQYETMAATMKKNGTFSPEVDAALREGLGLPPAKPEADKASQQQQEIAALGKQLAQYSPASIEAAPNVQQLSAAVNNASAKGNAR